MGRGPIGAQRLQGHFHLGRKMGLGASGSIHTRGAVGSVRKLLQARWTEYEILGCACLGDDGFTVAGAER